MSSTRPEPRARARLPGVRAPKPLLGPAVERRLTPRQRELVDALEELVVRGRLADLTMAEIAARTNCSLRTLYGIARRKEELVLAVVDRRLHRIGRRAIEALDASQAPLDALRAYLAAVCEAIDPERNALARELVGLAGAERMIDAHERYVVAVVKSLLDRALAEGRIARCDTASVAHLLGGLGREFARPEVADAAWASPRDTVAELTEIVLRGLVARSGAAIASGSRDRARGGRR